MKRGKMKLFSGRGFVGRSHRFGLVLSWEKHGVYLIIHLNHIRHWIGLVKDDYDKQYNIMVQPDEIQK